MGEHEDRILIGQRIAAARLARRLSQESYKHYQLADTTPAAQAVGDMLAG